MQMKYVCSVAIVISLASPPLSATSFFFSRKKRFLHNGSFSITRELRAGGHDVNGDPEDDDMPQNVLFLMDGFCSYHGGYMAERLNDCGNTVVIPVLSNYLCQYLQASDPDDAEHWKNLGVAKLDQRLQNDYTDLLERCQGRVAVYCESDSGLADAEALRVQLAKKYNSVLVDDPIQLEARRDKFLMQERVKEQTNLPTVSQCLCRTLSEALEFAAEVLSHSSRVIVKPHRGVASESVALCSTLEEVEAAWDAIISSPVFGAREKHDRVVMQEFLDGTEYAVDVVSRNGEHKIAAVWKYDKRPANGAPFCYFQTRLVDSGLDDNVESVCKYVKSSLDALGIRWGLSHDEVIVLRGSGQSTLVEINCRQHNMDFAPLTMGCIGYNALDMLLDAFFGEKEESWDRYPDMPTLRAHGCMVHLVNYADGDLEQVNHVENIANLESLLDFEIYDEFRIPGSVLTPTTDIRSDAGWVQLINPDEASLQKDYEEIVGLMPHMFATSKTGQL